MKNAIALIAGLLMGATAFAGQENLTTIVARMGQRAVVLDAASERGLNMKVGDEAKYNLDAGFIKGSMEMSVTSIGADGIWIQQLLDLGFAGKQDMKELIDPNTGEIKKLIVNGKEQTPPSNGNTEVVDSKEDTVTVPAGTFTCLYVKVKTEVDGKATNAEQWVNPKLVPVFGMVKMITESQLGPVTIGLVSFKRN